MRAFFRRLISSIIPRPVVTVNTNPLRHIPPAPPRVSCVFMPIMERVNVRCVEENETMRIAFVYADMNLCLQRDKKEKLEKSLIRVRASVLKKAKLVSKRSNKKLKQDQSSNDAQNLLVVSLHNCSGKEVDTTLTNNEAWQNGFVLNVGSFNYSVQRNSPTVTRLTLPRCAIVGCPVFPRVSLEFTESVKYAWYRGFPDASPSPLKTTNDGDQEVKKKRCGGQSDNISTTVNIPNVSHWEQVSTEKVYTPIDEGVLLKLECTPISESDNPGLTVHCTLGSTVRSIPMLPFEKRHSFTTKVTPDNNLRIVSYNILADLYADSDYSRDVLYPYCLPEMLHIDYREQLILKEITGYNADLICLQETGKKLFENALVPSLKTVGLDGLICYKHAQPEGEAIFYRTSKLRFVASHDLVLSDAFKNAALYADLLEVVSHNEAMLKRVVSRSSVVQVAVFEEVANPSRKICVTNTHLYFHPRAGHVRLIQTAIITRHLEQLKITYKQQHGCENLAVIFCCDLNSTPGSGAFELLSTGSVAKYAADWYSSGKEEFCGGIAMGHSLKLDRPYTSATYTNYVSAFQGLLDYIFYENQYFDLEQEVPLPAHSDVVQFTALPNQVFPSDHLALICDLKWNK